MPTITKTTSNNDDDLCVWYATATPAWVIMVDRLWFGCVEASLIQAGLGMQFQGITIPSSAIIMPSYLTFTAEQSKAGTTCNAKICALNTNGYSAFSTVADYQAKRDSAAWGGDESTLTSKVTWGNVGSWTADSTYQSPDISSIIKELLPLGFSNGNITLFVDDHDGLSTVGSGIGRACHQNEMGHGLTILTINYVLPLSGGIDKYIAGGLF